MGLKMSNTRNLPVRLHDDELLAKSKELAARVTELDEVDERKKSAVGQCKLKTDELNLDIRKLAKILRTGKEDRAVEVREERNDPARTIEVMRVDTGEIVESRPMTIHELQKPLFEDEDGKKVAELAADHVRKGMKVV